MQEQGQISQTRPVKRPDAEEAVPRDSRACGGRAFIGEPALSRKGPKRLPRRWDVLRFPWAAAAWASTPSKATKPQT